MTSGTAGTSALVGLNAPYGARCFLTAKQVTPHSRAAGLNAPYGARFFLTGETGRQIMDAHKRS